MNKFLESDGWTILRFWGKEIVRDVARCADIIEEEVNGDG